MFLECPEVSLLAECKDERFEALALLGANGGLRFAEIAGLRRKRIDVLRGRVTVAETLSDVNGVLSFGPPKTKRSPARCCCRAQSCASSKPTSAATARRVHALVLTGSKGPPLRRAGFRRCWWRPAVAAAELDSLKFHELRHTFMSLWRDAGADVLEVSRRAAPANRRWLSPWPATDTSIKTIRILSLNASMTSSKGRKTKRNI